MPQADLSPFGLHTAAAAAASTADAASAVSVARILTSITAASFTADGATQSKSVGTVPEGAIVLGVYLSVGTQFVHATADTVNVTALTVGGVDIMPAGLDNFDILAASGTAGAGAIFRPAEGAATVTISGLDDQSAANQNLNSLSAGALSVGIVYFVPA